MKKHILLLLALCGVQSHAYSNRVPVAKPAPAPAPVQSQEEAEAEAKALKQAEEKAKEAVTTTM